MGFIAKDARWYLADVILEHVIEGDPRNVVHVNTLLIEAESPEEAYRKAVSLGRRAKSQYLNTEGKRVRIKYRGLRELNVIHEDLEDGAELCYEEAVAISQAKLRRWIRSKKALGVFAPIRPHTGGPNYMPQSVMNMIEKHCKRHRNA
jgi:hypothetical protein